MSHKTTLPAAVVATGEPCLDVAGMAALLGCTSHHVVNQLAPLWSFPRPFIHISWMVRYWRSSDVLQWLRRPGVRALNLADLNAPLVNTAGIAQLLGCSREHAAYNVTKRVDFPLPCVNVSRRMRSWLYRDVLAWLDPQAALAAADIPAQRLLDVDGLAAQLDCTRQHFMQSMAMRPDFPAPYLYAGRSKQWWRAGDVQAWCRSIDFVSPTAATGAAGHPSKGQA